MDRRRDSVDAPLERQDLVQAIAVDDHELTDSIIDDLARHLRPWTTRKVIPRIRGIPNGKASTNDGAPEHHHHRESRRPRGEVRRREALRVEVRLAALPRDE